MIKTVVAKTPEELDKGVNDFMTTKNRNLPVRDGCELLSDGTMLYRAMIFFDYPFVRGNQYDNLQEENIVLEETKATPSTNTSNKIGALWIQKDGKITGKLNEKSVSMPDKATEVMNKMAIGEKLELVLDSNPVSVFKNKYKKTAKHPDYVIYKRGG